MTAQTRDGVEGGEALVPSRAVFVMTAHGEPGAQGSKRHVGGGRMVESSKKVEPWRQDVRAAAITAALATPTFGGPLLGALRVSMTFTLRKPLSAPKRLRTWPSKTPDLDKLVRSTGDALTQAGIWRDDAQIVELVAAKRYPNEGDDALATTGVVIRIESIVDDA